MNPVLGNMTSFTFAWASDSRHFKNSCDRKTNIFDRLYSSLQVSCFLLVDKFSRLLILIPSSVGYAFMNFGDVNAMVPLSSDPYTDTMDRRLILLLLVLLWLRVGHLLTEFS